MEAGSFLLVSDPFRQVVRVVSFNIRNSTRPFVMTEFVRPDVLSVNASTGYETVSSIKHYDHC